VVSLLQAPRLARLAALALVVVTCVSSAAAEPGCPSFPFPSQQVVVEPGVLGSRVARRVKVGAGDTLGELAQRHLGSVRHTAQIQALNPGVTATTLRVGSEVWVPPTPRSEEWLELLVLAPPRGRVPATVLARDSAYAMLPVGPVRIAAISAARLAALGGPDRITREALETDPQVALSAPFETQAADEAAVSRRTTRVRVRAVEGRRLVLEVLEQSLWSDAGRRVPLASEAALEHGTLAAPLLLLLGGLLVFALVAWAARRMAAGGPDAGSARS
jgi:hypothetical protein